MSEPTRTIGGGVGGSTHREDACTVLEAHEEPWDDVEVYLMSYPEEMVYHLGRLIEAVRLVWQVLREPLA